MIMLHLHRKAEIQILHGIDFGRLRDVYMEDQGNVVRNGVVEYVIRKLQED